jgi:TolB protein
LSGYLRTPAWSPDGRRLAFVRFLNGSNEIYVVNADGSHLRQLTGPRQDVIDELSSQAWSPDGRKLVFARGPNMSGLRARPTSIFVINADGTGIRQLTRDNSDDDPAWSPDGRRIAFARYGSTNDGSIYVMKSDGGHLRRVGISTSFPTPAWSPNGRELAFDSNETIEILTLQGRKATYLPPSTWQGQPIDNYEPTWSPGGKKLAFVADTDPGQVSTTWIEMRNLNGDHRRVVLSRGVHTVDYPAWSPSGRQIAFDVDGKLKLINVKRHQRTRADS